MPSTSSSVPSPASRSWSISSDVLIERQLDRPARCAAVVEQLQVELLDAGVDDEVIDVGELADDADRAAAIAVVNGDSRGSKKRT